MPFQKGHKINLGRKPSETTKKKMSASHKARIKKYGQNKPMLGKKHSLKAKRKMSRSHKALDRISGRKNPNWKGGISKNKEYRSWQKNKRNRIRQKLIKDGLSHTFRQWELLKSKYNNRCVNCGKKGKLTIDHIIPLSRGGSDLIENIQPLCKKCNFIKHVKTTNYLIK